MKTTLKLAIFTIILGFTASSIFAQNPRTAREWGDLGIKQLGQENYQQAVISFTKSLELLPDYYFSRINRGTAYFNLQKYNLAINDYNQVLKFKPFHAVTFYNRGLAYQQINKHSDAINDFTYATNFNSKDPDGYSARSVSYCKKGEIKLAKADEKKAIKLGGKITNPCGGASEKNSSANESVAGWKSMTFKGLTFQTPTTQTDPKCNARYNINNIHFAQTFYCYKWNNLTLDVGYGKANIAKSKTPNEAAIRRKAAEISFENKYNTGAENSYSTVNLNMGGAEVVLLKIVSDYGLSLIITEVIYIKRETEFWEISISYDGDEQAEISAENRIIKSLSIK